MKNVLIISSTPRINGNSEILAKEFMRGAQAKGNNVEFIDLKENKLEYCIGCYSCHKTGLCVHKDNMNEIGLKMTKADVIVFATPVYFYSMSGQLKVFIDRLVPWYTKINADIYFIATQYDDNKKLMDMTFEAIRGCTRKCFDNCTEKGVLYGVGLDGRGEASHNKEYMEKAYNMGYNC